MESKLVCVINVWGCAEIFCTPAGVRNNIGDKVFDSWLDQTSMDKASLSSFENINVKSN